MVLWLSNILSVALIYVGILAGTYVSVMQQGGIGAIAAKLPFLQGWFDPDRQPWTGDHYWLVCCYDHASHHCTGACTDCLRRTDGSAARNGYLWGALIIFPIGFLCALMGLAAKVAYPNIKATMALPSDHHEPESGLYPVRLWPLCGRLMFPRPVLLLLGAGTLFSIRHLQAISQSPGK